MIKSLNKCLLVSVSWILLSQVILNTLVVAPFNKLCNLVAHKVKLSARVSHLMKRQGSHACKLSPPVPWHALNKAALTVDNLIVAEWQHKVLIELIHAGEGQKTMVTWSIREVRLAIMQRIIHPTHVPLKVKAKSPNLGRIGNQRPCCGLFCNHQNIGMFFLSSLVAETQESACIQIFLCALMVKALLRRIVDTKIQIQHATDTVNTNAISVIVLQPHEQVRNKEASNLTTSKIKLKSSPVRMLFFFKELGTIKLCKTMSIFAEASWDPV